MSTWFHYSNQEIKFDRPYPYANRKGRGLDELGPFYKPHGFWVTDESDSCWKSWCLSEDFRLENLTHKHAVEIDGTHLKVIRNAAQFRKFQKEFGCMVPMFGESRPSIDWMKLYGGYTGLIIAPYFWQFRLDMDCQWYYGWDCSGGCIWDLSAIKDVKLVEALGVADLQKMREAA